MGDRAAGLSRKFSPFRSFDFETVVFLVFEPEAFQLCLAREVEPAEIKAVARYRFLVFEPEAFQLCLAREVEPAEIKAVARYSTHTNGWQPTLRQVESFGDDVMQEMQAAYARLDDGINAE